MEEIVSDIIDKQKTAFISSVDSDGYPNTKAMLAPREHVGIRTIYFSTNTSSVRVEQYRSNNKACVYFCDSSHFKGVMLRGTMEVLTDGEIRRRIWRTGDRVYYRKGVDDPDYCVLKFTAVNGRYYSSMHSEDFEITE